MWDGGTARQLGLVDGFGGMSEAIGKAAELAKLGDSRGVRYFEPPKSFRQELVEALAGDSASDKAAPEDAFATLAREPARQFAAMIAEVRTILEGPSIQARCLECPPVAPARIDRRDESVLSLVKSWLD